MADVLVVTSKVKAAAKKLGLRTAADFIEGLSKLVEAKIKAAAVKTEAAKRKTIQAEDLTD